MIAYTVLVSFGMRTVSFLERLFSPGIGSYAANLTEVKTRMPNAKVLSEKQAIVASLTEKLQGAAAGIIVDYKGITVAEDTALRAECRKNEVDYAVVKNTLLRFAFNNVGLNELDEQLNGTTALAVASDPVAPARVIADYAKKLNGKFEIKGGFMDGKDVDMATINALAAIPALPVRPRCSARCSRPSPALPASSSRSLRRTALPLRRPKPLPSKSGIQTTKQTTI